MITLFLTLLLHVTFVGCWFWWVSRSSEPRRSSARSARWPRVVSALFVCIGLAQAAVLVADPADPDRDGVTSSWTALLELVEAVGPSDESVQHPQPEIAGAWRLLVVRHSRGCERSHTHDTDCSREQLEFRIEREPLVFQTDSGSQIR